LARIELHGQKLTRGRERARGRGEVTEREREIERESQARVGGVNGAVARRI
jgi:hypothetical protein